VSGQPLAPVTTDASWARFAEPSEKQVLATGSTAPSYLEQRLAGEEREDLIDRIHRQRERMYGLTGDAFDSAQRDLLTLEVELSGGKP
jgi:hypothetical protein